MAYELEGDLLEVGDCGVLCPCWIGEDADNGTSDAIVAYNVHRGTIDGTDVSGLSICLISQIPGNILQGNWRVAVFVDHKASKLQEDALLNVWTGKLGGPMADLAKLVGEVVTVQRAPITFEVKEGRGTLKVGSIAAAVMAPVQRRYRQGHNAPRQCFLHHPRVSRLHQQGFALLATSQPLRAEERGPPEP